MADDEDGGVFHQLLPLDPGQRTDLLPPHRLSLVHLPSVVLVIYLNTRSLGTLAGGPAGLLTLSFTLFGRSSRVTHADESIMTKNRVMVTIHSQGVTEILALYSNMKFDFPPQFLKGLMHSFPMMYDTMGSKLNGLAGRGHFLQKITLEMAV